MLRRCIHWEVGTRRPIRPRRVGIPIEEGVVVRYPDYLEWVRSVLCFAVMGWYVAPPNAMYLRDMYRENRQT